MSFDGAFALFGNGAIRCVPRRGVLFTITKHRKLFVLFAIYMLVQASGCVSDEVGNDRIITKYQQIQAGKGPQHRADTEGRDLQKPLGLLSPAPETAVSTLEVTTDPNTGKEIYNLAIEEAISRALTNSPEIRVVSFDPSIAKEEVTKAAAEFDFTAFGRLNYEKEDNPVNSIFQAGQSNSRLLQSGIKQKGTTGAEWSASYVLTRNWDDLVGRALPTRYEPILSFQIRQPLLRDAWEQVNLAGVNIAKLNHEISVTVFREKAEDISTQVISAYWILLQARRDLKIQERLLDRTLETLTKVQGRREIDATAVQIKQTEASLKAREAFLLQVKKRVVDVQDVLIRLLADPQVNLLGDLEIVPVTLPNLAAIRFGPLNVLELAMKKNPVIQQVRIGVAIADINIAVAKNQKMPRVDLVASARTQSLAKGESEAHDRLGNGDFASYAVGLTLEYPLGNRQREAELRRRKLERSKAVSVLQNLADQVAAQAKERIRRVDTNHQEIQVQKDAVQAAKTHLQAVEDTESIREKLTPEFLLVKLQAQEALAEAERAEIRAVADYNVSLAQLAQTMGTVLELHQVKTALPVVLRPNNIFDDKNGTMPADLDLPSQEY